MRYRKTLAWTGALALLPAGFLIVAATTNAADVPDSEQVSKLLSETKTMAFQLKEDAATMESFTRMNVSWESHKVTINQIKDHVNALRRQVEKLNEVKATASPWQKQAIDRITPYLDEMEGYTLAIIEHLNGQTKHTLAEYKDYLEANADYSSDLASMIANFVDYGKTKEKVQNLGAKLEVPTKK
jgi:hypothetical protein